MKIEDFYKDLEFQLKSERHLLKSGLVKCKHLFVGGECILCQQKKVDKSAHLSH